MDNDFIVRLMARLDASKTDEDIKSIEKKLADKGIKLKTVIDQSASIQEMNNLVRELKRVLSEAGLNIDTQTLRKTISNLAKEVPQIFNTTELDKQGKVYLQKVRNTVEKTKSELETKLKNAGYVDIEIRGIEDANGKVKSLVASVTDANGVLKQLNFNREQIQNGGKAQAGFVQADDVKVLGTVSELISTTSAKLENMQNKWSEQGVLVGAFKEKVDQLSTSLQNVSSKGELNKIQTDLQNLNVEASKLSEVQRIQFLIDTDGYKVQIEQYKVALQKAGVSGTELTTKMQSVNNAFTQLTDSTNKKEIIPNEVISKAKELDDAFVKLKNEVKSVNLSNSLKADDIKVDATINRLSEQLRKNSAYSKDAKAQLQAFIYELNSIGASEARLAEINSEARKLHTNMARLNKIGKSFGQSIKDQAAKFMQWVSVSSIVMRVFRTIREGISDVIDLDTALVDLQKTTDATAEELEDFYYQSNETAKELGATTEEVIDAASAWSRLGYSIRDAKQMAENSSIFASISPEMDIDTATDGLVSMMKAFDIDAEDSLDGIISKVNEVGNSFAVSNDMIVEAMERSSAAMVAANNSLDQTIAMNTASAEITQNAEVTSNALRTMSMRIRGYDEETEEYIGGVEELTGIIADLTKTASNPSGISLFTDDTKETYKSTYDLLDEISTIYDDLSDKSQANITCLYVQKCA